jgi:hypothetical protein
MTYKEKEMLQEEFDSTGRPSTTELPPEQRGKLRRILRITLGLFLLLGGIAGLVLPILQGWLMIFAALAILRKDLPWAAYMWEHWLVPLQQRVQQWLRSVRRR